MDKTEARSVALERLERLRLESHEDLQAYLRDCEHSEVSGPSGLKYQLEVSATWDDEGAGNLRVWVDVDDGGWRAFSPLSVEFIMTPEGQFIGESPLADESGEHGGPND